MQLHRERSLMFVLLFLIVCVLMRIKPCVWLESSVLSKDNTDNVPFVPLCPSTGDFSCALSEQASSTCWGEIGQCPVGVADSAPGRDPVPAWTSPVLGDTWLCQLLPFTQGTNCCWTWSLNLLLNVARFNCLPLQLPWVCFLSLRWVFSLLLFWNLLWLHPSFKNVPPIVNFLRAAM